MKTLVFLLLGVLFSLAFAEVPADGCYEMLVDKDVSVRYHAAHFHVDLEAFLRVNNINLAGKSADSVFLKKGQIVRMPTLMQELSGPTFSPSPAIKDPSAKKPKTARRAIRAKKKELVSDDGNFWSRFVGIGKGMPYNREDYREYTFRADSGDVLTKPAKTYKVGLRLLRAFNSMPSWALSLNDGEEVLIPDREYGYWINFDRNPFGKRDYDKLFKRFAWGNNCRLLAEVERKILAKEFENGIIHSGQCLFQMGEGGSTPTEFHVDNNMVVAQKNDLAAELYRIPLVGMVPGGEGKILVVAKPDVCFNWCWWIEEEKQVIAPEPTLPPVETPAPIDTPATVIEPPIEFIKVVYGGWLQMPRGIIYVTHDIPEEKGVGLVLGRRGASCLGANFEDFFRKRSWQTRNSFGVAGEINFYDGEAFISKFVYDGFNISGGPAVIWSPFQIAYLSLDGGIGHQWDWGRLIGVDYHYNSFQTSLFWKVGSTFDLVPPFWNLSFWGSYRKSFPEYTKKDSYTNGVQESGVNDPPNMLDAWNFGIHSYFWVECPVHPLVGWEENHTKSDGALRMFLSAGIRCCNKQLIIKAGYVHCENSKWLSDRANGARVEAVWGWGYGRGRPKLPKSQPEQITVGETPKLSAGGGEVWGN